MPGGKNIQTPSFHLEGSLKHGGIVTFVPAVRSYEAQHLLSIHTLGYIFFPNTLTYMYIAPRCPEQGFLFKINQQ